VAVDVHVDDEGADAAAQAAAISAAAAEGARDMADAAAADAQAAAQAAAVAPPPPPPPPPPAPPPAAAPAPDLSGYVKREDLDVYVTELAAFSEPAAPAADATNDKRPKSLDDGKAQKKGGFLERLGYSDGA
jgi:hypothetical protein